MSDPTHDNATAGRPGFEALIDLIGQLGREVFYLLDDCETSGPVGDETHTITPDALQKVSDVLDRIDALPFEEPGCILGTGAMLQAALKQTMQAERDAATTRAYTAEAEARHWKANYNGLMTQAEAALSRVTEAKAEAERIADDYHWDSPYQCAGAMDEMRGAIAALAAALAQSGGADPAQGGV